MYLVKAYADAEYVLNEQRVIIEAENYEKAQGIARDRFAEYHEVVVYELKGGAE